MRDLLCFVLFCFLNDDEEEEEEDDTTKTRVFHKFSRNECSTLFLAGGEGVAGPIAKTR